MERRVDTLVICDGGRKDKYGFDAAYIPIRGIPIIGYSIRTGVQSKHIKRIYVYSDYEEKVLGIAKEMFSDEKRLKIVDSNTYINEAGACFKFLRVLPAETKLAMSISKTFYRYIVNDLPGVERFSGDWSNADNLSKYLQKNPYVRELPVAFMGNDQPLSLAADLDDMIEAYSKESCDSLIGYTKKAVLSGYLSRSCTSIGEFHSTLKKNDFIDGSWMRHNCFFVLKWGKMDDRLLDVISYYNQHRVQSKLPNFVLVLLRIISKYLGKGPEIANALRIAFFFAIGKYFKSFNNSRVRWLVTKNVNSGKIVECSGRLVGHKIAIFPDGTARSVIDIDDAKDVAPVSRLLSLRAEGLLD